jgi:hypothetical protein
MTDLLGRCRLPAAGGPDPQGTASGPVRPGIRRRRPAQPPGGGGRRLLDVVESPGRSIEPMLQPDDRPLGIGRLLASENIGDESSANVLSPKCVSAPSGTAGVLCDSRILRP